MRFVLRQGDGPHARADVAMLAAIGLPGGGLIQIGETAVRVVPAQMKVANELSLPPYGFDNGKLRPGSSTEAVRVVMPAATSAVITIDGKRLDEVPRELVGVPTHDGERFKTEIGMATISRVQPNTGGVLSPSTAVTAAADAHSKTELHHDSADGPAPMIAGLENELDLLTGWLRLLTDSAGNGRNGAVAGIVIAGPTGSGRAELVLEAASASDLSVEVIDLRTVTTPDRLLAKLEAAVRNVPAATVLYLDRLDALIDRDSATRHQSAAVMRWFLEKVANMPAVTAAIATIRGTTAVDLDATDLLRRTLTIAAPSHDRRLALLTAALSDAPDVDLDAVSNATPGFSALDISTAVLEARARTSGVLTTEIVLEAVRSTRPSLGTMHLGDVPSYGFDRVANLTAVKRALTESVIWQLTEPERFDRMGIEPAKGLLLYGPPGTGKTYVIRALAHESGAAFFAVKGAELLDKWVGESERGVREVFSRANAVAPAIIFFDEIDALAPIRGSSTNNVTDSVVAALLTELDGVGARADVFVVAATNRKDLIDPALLRPGRLEVHLHLDLPEPESRRAFFEMTSVPLAADVELDALVSATEGMSFADLDGLLRRAAIISLRADPHSTTVAEHDIAAAISDN